MNFHGPVHPAAYTLVTATPVALPTAANGSIPAFTPATTTVPQSGYGLMNQPCQRFTGEPQSSPKPRLAAAAGPAQLASQRPPRVVAQGSVEEAPSPQHGSIRTELDAVCVM